MIERAPSQGAAWFNGLESHLTPELRTLTVNLIATELLRAQRARRELEGRLGSAFP